MDPPKWLSVGFPVGFLAGFLPSHRTAGPMWQRNYLPSREALASRHGRFVCVWFVPPNQILFFSPSPRKKREQNNMLLVFPILVSQVGE